MNIALQELGGGGNVSGAPGSRVEPPTRLPSGGREAGGQAASGRGSGLEEQGLRGRGGRDPGPRSPGGEGASLQTGGARPGERRWGWAGGEQPDPPDLRGRPGLSGRWWSTDGPRCGKTTPPRPPWRAEPPWTLWR